MMSLNINILIVVAHLSVLCLGSGRDGWPGYVYHPQLHGYLKLHKEPANWLTARVNCHSEGALLTSPWTADFTSAVHDLQTNQQQSPPVLFSGTLVSFPEGSYKNYVERLPGVLMNSDLCGVFFSNGTTGDASCRLEYPYVCYAPDSTTTTTEQQPEFTTTASTTFAPTPSCEGSGYEFANKAGRCYKFHTDASRWPDANRTCTAEGAAFVVINSDVEASVLAEIYKQHPATSIEGNNDFKNNVLIGIYWESGVWKTVDGQTPEQAGYDKWVKGQPNNETNYPYGIMNRDGLLNNGNDANWLFICEKEPADWFQSVF